MLQRRCRTARRLRTCEAGGAGFGVGGPYVLMEDGSKVQLVETADFILLETLLEDTKVSALTELDEGANVVDYLYVADGNENDSKYTAGDSGFAVRGAQVKVNADTATDFNPATDVTEWDTSVYDTQGAEGLNKVWLGTNATVTFTNGNDECDLTSHGMITGDGPFQFTTDDTLPAELATSTDYWAILVDANNFKMASSLVNALAETAIAITDDGTGTHTIDRASRLIVPADYDLVRLHANVSFTNLDGSRLGLSILKDGSADYQGHAGKQGVFATTVQRFYTCETGIIPVTEGGGAYFTLEIGTEDAAQTIMAGSSFSMQLLGRDS